MSVVALIGAGAMGQAMLQAWIDSGVLKPGEVVVSEKDDVKRGELSARLGVKEAETNEAAAAGSDVVVLAVKPQDSGAVLESVAPSLGPDTVVVSIAAGLTLQSIRSAVGAGPSIVRVMPNMGAQVRSSISAYAVDEGERVFDRSIVAGLLESIGETVEVPEESMNLVTALSGSGPAYFFLFVEALEQAGIAQGLPVDVARTLARETLWGAAKVLKETGREAAELRQAVSSPGGTTLAALAELDKAGFAGLVNRAVDAARIRAGELAR